MAKVFMRFTIEEEEDYDSICIFQDENDCSDFRLTQVEDVIICSRDQLVFLKDSITKLLKESEEK